MLSRRVLLCVVVLALILLALVVGRSWARRTADARFNRPAQVEYRTSQGF